MVHLCVLTILSYQVSRKGVSNNNKQKHSYKSLLYRPPSSLGRVSVLFIYLINIIQYCFIDLTLHIIRLTVFVQLFHRRRTNDRTRYQFILITPCQGQLRGSHIVLCGTITIRIHDRFIHTTKISIHTPRGITSIDCHYSVTLPCPDCDTCPSNSHPPMVSTFQEQLEGLQQVVQSGKVQYVGPSNETHHTGSVNL